jgi:hypothetical protein
VRCSEVICPKFNIFFASPWYEGLRMVSVFLYHVVGDLTVGKPDSTFSLLLLGVSRQTNEGLRYWRRTSSSPVGERFFGGQKRGVRERGKRKKNN